MKPQLTNEMQISTMRSTFTMALDDLYASNSDEGLLIKHDPRQSSTYVESAKSFKSLVLIPCSHQLVVEMNKTAKCGGIQSCMGQVAGQYVMITPKQAIFDKRAQCMVVTIKIALPSRPSS